LDVWLRQRRKIMAGQEDEGWLFISEFGGRLDEGRFLKALKKIVTLAEISDHITLHSLRRYSLNRLAKVNLLATQLIAGHKETRTTLLYTQLDLDLARSPRQHRRGARHHRQLAHRQAAQATGLGCYMPLLLRVSKVDTSLRKAELTTVTSFARTPSSCQFFVPFALHISLTTAQSCGHSRYNGVGHVYVLDGN